MDGDKLKRINLTSPAYAIAWKQIQENDIMKAMVSEVKKALKGGQTNSQVFAERVVLDYMMCLGAIKKIDNFDSANALALYSKIVLSKGYIMEECFSLIGQIIGKMPKERKDELIKKLDKKSMDEKMRMMVSIPANTSKLAVARFLASKSKINGGDKLTVKAAAPIVGAKYSMGINTHTWSFGGENFSGNSNDNALIALLEGSAAFNSELKKLSIIPYEIRRVLDIGRTVDALNKGGVLTSFKKDPADKKKIIGTLVNSEDFVTKLVVGKDEDDYKRKVLAEVAQQFLPTMVIPTMKMLIEDATIKDEKEKAKAKRTLDEVEVVKGGIVVSTDKEKLAILHHQFGKAIGGFKDRKVDNMET